MTRHCILIRYTLTKAEKDEIVNKLWGNWEDLNTEYQEFTHKKVLCEITKARKLEIESRMQQIENLIDQLKMEHVAIDKRNFKFE